MSARAPILVLGLAALAGLPARGSAASSGAAPLLQELEPLLPRTPRSPARLAATSGITLAFAAPLRAARTGERGVEAVRLRLRGLAAALERQGDAAAAGPTHRELELRHLDLGDARALLARLATRLERAGTSLDPRVGQARLRTALALEEILRTAQADLDAMGRTLRRSADLLGAGRRSVAHMLGFVETIQDQAALPSRERVRLGTRGGAARKLALGLRRLDEHLAGPGQELERVRSLLRVRWTGVREALRNLARGADRPDRPLRGGPALAARLDEILETVRREFRGLAAEAEALEEGRRVVPDLPELPAWLFTRPEEEAPAPVAAAGGPPGERAEVLALLDEIEAELTRDTEVYEDPLTATLAGTFRQRHDLPESPGEAEILPGDPAELDALEALLDAAGDPGGTMARADERLTSEPKDGILVVGP